MVSLKVFGVLLVVHFVAADITTIPNGLQIALTKQCSDIVNSLPTQQLLDFQKNLTLAADYKQLMSAINSGVIALTASVREKQDFIETKVYELISNLPENLAELRNKVSKLVNIDKLKKDIKEGTEALKKAVGENQIDFLNSLKAKRDTLIAQYKEIITKLPKEKLEELKKQLSKNPQLSKLLFEIDKGTDKIKDAIQDKQDELKKQFKDIVEIPKGTLDDLAKKLSQNVDLSSFMKAINSGSEALKGSFQKVQDDLTKQYKDIVNNLSKEKLEELTKKLSQYPEFSKFLNTLNQGTDTLKELIQKTQDGLTSELKQFIASPKDKIDDLIKKFKEYPVLNDFLTNVNKATDTLNGSIKKAQDELSKQFKDIVDKTPREQLAKLTDKLNQYPVVNTLLNTLGKGAESLKGSIKKTQDDVAKQFKQIVSSISTTPLPSLPDLKDAAKELESVPTKLDDLLKKFNIK